MNDRLEGYEVRLPKLHFRLFSLSMALDGLVVRQKAHPDPPVLRIERLTTSVHWRALLSGHLVGDVLLERPQVDLNLVQLRQEVKDGVPVNERGWQEALQEVTPLKIDLFRVEDGTVTYVDADPAHPIRMTALRIVANDIRNVQSKPQVYPSPIHAEGDALRLRPGRSRRARRLSRRALPGLSCSLSSRRGPSRCALPSGSGAHGVRPQGRGFGCRRGAGNVAVGAQRAALGTHAFGRETGLRSGEELSFGSGRRGSARPPVKGRAKGKRSRRLDRIRHGHSEWTRPLSRRASWDS